MKYIGGKPRFYKPEYLAESVGDIDFRLLKRKGIEVALIDLDGTVVERGQYEVSPKITKILKSQPLKIYIATNRPKSRDLKNLKEQLHAQGVIHPRGLLGKPFTTYYEAAVETIGLKPVQAIMIGDRYIQDIIGANRAGLHTLVVNKIDKPTNFFDKVLSTMERRLTAKLLKAYKEVK